MVKKFAEYNPQLKQEIKRESLHPLFRRRGGPSISVSRPKNGRSHRKRKLRPDQRTPRSLLSHRDAEIKYKHHWKKKINPPFPPSSTQIKIKTEETLNFRIKYNQHSNLIASLRKASNFNLEPNLVAARRRRSIIQKISRKFAVRGFAKISIADFGWTTSESGEFFRRGIHFLPEEWKNIGKNEEMCLQ